MKHHRGWSLLIGLLASWASSALRRAVLGYGIDRMKEATTEEAYRQAGHNFQRDMAENMMITSVASVPLLQAARTVVRGYEHLHGYKIRFETRWLGKP
ncbi:MAG: hypothetical protein HYZ81_03030 [Nitrospinae bacterium]|nr:hypothetical protein [Nitrospinota bacterium]